VIIEEHLGRDQAHLALASIGSFSSRVQVFPWLAIRIVGAEEFLRLDFLYGQLLGCRGTIAIPDLLHLRVLLVDIVDGLLLVGELIAALFADRRWGL